MSLSIESGGHSAHYFHGPLPASPMSTSKRVIRVKAQPAMPRAKPDQGFMNESVYRANGQAESFLDHKARENIHQVRDAVVSFSGQVAEEVTQWVDGPSNWDGEAHGTEGFPHVLVPLGVASAHVAGLIHEYLKEDDEGESTTGHAEGEARPRIMHESVHQANGQAESYLDHKARENIIQVQMLSSASPDR